MQSKELNVHLLHYNFRKEGINSTMMWLDDFYKEALHKSVELSECILSETQLNDVNRETVGRIRRCVGDASEDWWPNEAVLSAVHTANLSQSFELNFSSTRGRYCSLPRPHSVHAAAS